MLYERPPYQAGNTLCHFLFMWFVCYFADWGPVGWSRFLTSRIGVDFLILCIKKNFSYPRNISANYVFGVMIFFSHYSLVVHKTLRELSDLFKTYTYVMTQKKISEYFCGGRLIQSTRIRVDSNHLTKKPYFDPSIQYDSHAKGPSINYGVKRDWRTVKESGNLDGFHNKPSSKEIDDGLSKHWDFWRRILWTPPTKIHHILMPDVIV